MCSPLFAVLCLATLPARAGFFIDSQVGLKASPSTSVEYATRSMKFQTVGLEGGVRGGVRGWGMSLGLALTFSYNSTSSSYDGGTPATDTMTSQRVGLGVILGTDSKGAWNTWLGYYPVSGETYEGNSIRHLAPQDQSKGTAAELGTPIVGIPNCR